MTQKTDPITYISPNCMIPIFHELERLYYVTSIEQCFSCQNVEMWRWTASTKYFTRPASCGPQVGCYKRDKILHQKILTGKKNIFLKLPSEEPLCGQINVIHTKTQALSHTHVKCWHGNVTNSYRYQKTHFHQRGSKWWHAKGKTFHYVQLCHLPTSLIVQVQWQCLQQH